MMSKYQHVFFDLDHTLWDHDRNSKETLIELYDEFRIHAHEVRVEDFIDRYLVINRKFWKKYRQYKVGKEELRINRFKNTLTSLSVRLQDEDYSKISDSYIDRMSKKDHLLISAMELLEYLKPKYDLHIITNGFKEIQTRKLTYSGLLPFFDQVIISEEVGKHKPHPKVFQHALSLSTAAASNSIMIGDNLEADIMGARSVGMDQIYLNQDSRKHTQEVTFEVKSLKEVLSIL